MRIIKSFVASLRLKWLHWRVDREIYGGIFPHLRHDTDCGYSFQSDEELWAQLRQANLEAKRHIDTLESQADEMGEAAGDAFRYIMYWDINRRLARYEKIMRRDRQPGHCDPRFIATRA